MKLPPAWEAIVDVRTNASYGEHYVSRLRAAVERCYALANKPPIPLTDAEIEALDRKARKDLGPGWQPDPIAFARAIIAAHIAKQREPETVKFRAAHKNGKVEMLQADLQLGKEFDWEWLDADGKPQEFEVKV